MADNNSQKKTNIKSEKKHPFKRFCIFFLVFALVWWYNNFTLKITETSVSSPKITEPVRIAVLSDLHVHDGSVSNSDILGKIKKIEPDAVFVLGDMYSRQSDKAKINIALDLMSDIASDYPAYFVSGDHDMAAGYLSELSGFGVHVMNYNAETLEIKGNRFQIMGIDNVYYTPTFDLNNAFYLDESCFSILLAHIPNYEKFAAFGADLTLCADTHGGMLRIPVIGPVYDSLSGKYLPTLRNGEVYDKGWFEYNGGSMFITSGIGDSPYPVRLCNRPEVVSIDILGNTVQSPPDDFA